MWQDFEQHDFCSCMLADNLSNLRSYFINLRATQAKLMSSVSGVRYDIIHSWKLLLTSIRWSKQN